MAITKLAALGLGTGVGGKVLQVVSTNKTDTFSTSQSASFADITGLSVSITPSSTSNKILITYTTYVNGAGGGDIMTRLVRGSTAICIGDSAGSRLQSTAGGDNRSTYEMTCHQMTYLDSPSTTSSTTYKIQIIINPAGSTGTAYVNRSGADANDTNAERVVSTITVMEIKG